MAKKLEAIIKESIDINRIALNIRRAGFRTATERIAGKSLDLSNTMEKLCCVTDRLVKQANGWFLDRYLSRHSGHDYFWSPKPEEKHINWNDAEKHAQSLDARQPSVFELQSLKDYAKEKPAAIESAKILELSIDDYYWTREVTAWSSDGAWIVSFGNG